MQDWWESKPDWLGCKQGWLVNRLDLLESTQDWWDCKLGLLGNMPGEDELK